MEEGGHIRHAPGTPCNHLISHSFLPSPPLYFPSSHLPYPALPFCPIPYFTLLLPTPLSYSLLHSSPPYPFVLFPTSLFSSLPLCSIPSFTLLLPTLIHFNNSFLVRISYSQSNSLFPLFLQIILLNSKKSSCALYLLCVISIQSILTHSR